MSFSSRSHRRQMRQKRQLLTFALISLVFLAAAIYLYGNQFRIYLLLNKGRTYIQEGNLDQALARFNQALKLSPNNPQATDAIGLVYLIQGDPVRAEIKYEQAIKLGLTPNRRFNHVKLGDSYLTRGLVAPAELEFRHALDLSPRDAAARLGHAYTLHALGRVTDAIDEYRKVLAQDPNQKVVQASLGRARQDLERGCLYYMYDRRHTALARFSLVNKAPNLRYYALGQYAAHITGYVSAEHGAAGLEKALQPYFPGNEVTLTINAEWQRAADRAFRWRKGSLVAVDPRTGEILAMVNHPSFDPNHLDADWDRLTRNKNTPLKNRATEGLYEPGSIFKTITAAAALETHLALNKVFPIQCRGSARYDDRTFWCWKKHNQVDSMQEALDTSCNIGMAEVGFALGPDRLYEYASRFGFGAPLQPAMKSQALEWSFPIATSQAPPPGDTRFALAEYACGLGEGTLITPLHAALLAATVANGGRMPAPILVKEVRNIRGELLAAATPAILHTPVTPDVAQILKIYMVDTVNNGIGTKASVAGIAVAGKTGTTGNSQEGGLNGWFICFAPADKPQIAVAVFAEHEGTGMDTAAPIAHTFLEDVLKNEY
jgi:penicillin-binding protein A